MAIDVFRDELLTYAEAAKLLPERARPSYGTWHRWCTVGLDGVRLESVMIRGRRYTTKEALQAFLAARALPRAAREAATASGWSSPQRRDADHRQTEDQLRHLGILGRSHDDRPRNTDSADR